MQVNAMKLVLPSIGFQPQLQIVCAAFACVLMYMCGLFSCIYVYQNRCLDPWRDVTSLLLHLTFHTDKPREMSLAGQSKLCYHKGIGGL